MSSRRLIPPPSNKISLEAFKTTTTRTRSHNNTDDPLDELVPSSLGGTAQHLTPEERRKLVEARKRRNWAIGVAIVIAVIVFIVIAAAFSSLWLADEARKLMNSRQFVLQFVPDDDPDGFGTGLLVLNKNRNTIKWEMIFGNISATITGAEIRGPLSFLEPLETATVFFDLGTEQDHANTLEDKKHFSDRNANKLIDDPHLYYVLILTDEFPAGAVRSPLGAAGL